MSKTLEELKADGQQFIQAFEQLDEDGKRSAISYMRGLRDGQLISEKKPKLAAG